MMVRDFVYGEIESWKDDPMRAGDFASISTTAVFGYISYATYVAGVSVPGGGQVVLIGVGAISALWSILQYYEII